MNRIHVTTMQKWLDALHVTTLMIKELVLQLINVAHAVGALKIQLKEEFTLRCFHTDTHAIINLQG